MTDFPDLKIKALVSFPATIIDGAGIDVVKQNGTYQFDLAYNDFAPPVAGISDPSHQNALLWNDITNSYVLAPISLIGSGGSVPEAPNDGIQYGRQSLTWTPIVASGGGTPSNTNPVMDGVAAPGVLTTYSRGDHVHPIDTSRAPLASPTFTGVPAAPTAAPATNTTQLATTAFVAAAVSASGGVTPSALTRTNDTNVTLTLGGTPATALLQATSITVGWSGTLAASRGGFGADVSAQSGVPLFATGAPTFTATTGNGNFVRADSPALTTTPTAPTAAFGTNTTQIATTAFVATAVAVNDTAWTTYTPTVTSQAGPYTSASAAGRYRSEGKTVFVNIVISIATNGTAAGFGSVTLPFPVAAPSAFMGRVYNTGKIVAGSMNAAGSNAILYTDNGGIYVGADGYQITFNAVYEKQ